MELRTEVRSDMRSTVKKIRKRLFAGALALAVFMTTPGAELYAASKKGPVPGNGSGTESIDAPGNEAGSEIIDEAGKDVVPESTGIPEKGAEPGSIDEPEKGVMSESTDKAGNTDAPEEGEEPGIRDEAEKKEKSGIEDVSGGDPKPADTDVSEEDPDADIMLLAEDGLTENSVACVTIGGETKYYDRFPDAWNAAQGKAATVRILKSVDLDSRTDLIINDAATDITLEMSEGVVLEGYSFSSRCFMNIQAGSLTMKSGEIRNNGTLQVRGVDVQGGSFTLDGGRVTAVAGSDGRGVYMEGGSFTMHGGEVTGSQYGLIFSKGSDIRIDGGEITSTGVTTAVKAAIFGYNSTLIIDSGTFKALGKGNVVNVEGGTVEISDGSFTAETYTALSLKSCDVTISGGTFQGGSSGCAIDAQPVCSMKISGGFFTGGSYYSLRTAGDTVFDWLEEGYAYHDEDGNIIKPDKSPYLLQKNNVTVGECSHLWSEWNVDREGNHNRTCSACDKTESGAHTFDGNGTCSVCGQQATAAVTVSGKTDYYFFMDIAWEAAQGKTAAVKVLQDVNMAGEPLVIEDPGSDITLEVAEGVTLLSEKYSNIDGELIHVKGGNFTLAGGCVKFANKGSEHIDGGCTIRVNGGNVRIEDGLVKTYGSVSGAGNGPAVKVESGSLTILGGKLEQIGYPASGLYVAGGEAVIEGGEIEGKYRGIYATGGKTVVKDGTVIARSGAITGNDANVYGGAVYVGGGDVTVEGGTIRETGEMYRFSYGIYVDSGSISISGGEISGIRDGIYLAQSSGGTIRISGGSFTGDSDYGLQANADQSDSITLSGGTFTGGWRAILSASNKLMTLPEEGYAYYTVENGKKELFLPSSNDKSSFPKNTAVVDRCTHSFGDWKSNGNGTHAHICRACGLEEEVACDYQYEDMSGGDGTGVGAGHRGVCSVCGYSPGQESHTYGSWTFTGNNQCARACTLCGRRQTAGITRPFAWLQRSYRNPNVNVLSVSVSDATASYVWKKKGEEAVLSTTDSYSIPVDLTVGDHPYECAVTLDGETEPVVTWGYTVRIMPAPLAGAQVTVNGGGPVYFDGVAKEPSLVVTKDGQALQKDVDYTVIYTDNTAVGTAGYTLTGINNYKGTLAGTFRIERYETAETATTSEGWSNGAKITAPEGYTVGFEEGGTFASYLIYDTQTGEEGTEVSYYLKQNNTGYITDAKKITVKVDTTLPSLSMAEEGIKITDRDTWWQKLLRVLSFGYYKPQQVTIQASDALSGIAGIYYYIENTDIPTDEETGKSAMTAQELDALEEGAWTALTLKQAEGGEQTASASGSFGLSAEGSYVIYACAVDRAGNRSAYVCSDGIVVDTTAPVLTLTAPTGEELKDTAAIAKMQMNEAGTVTYMRSCALKTGCPWPDSLPLFFWISVPCFFLSHFLINFNSDFYPQIPPPLPPFSVLPK